MGHVRQVWRTKTEVILPMGVLTLALLLGGLGGLLFASGVEGEGGAALIQYLTAYFQLVKEGETPARLATILWSQCKLPICCFLLGFSTVGLVGIPVLLGIQGFSLVYSVSCLYRIFGESGMVCGGFLFGLTALLTIPALYVMGVQGMQGGVVLLRRTLGGHRLVTPYDGAYFGRCALCGLAVAAAVVVEWLIVPVLLQSVVGRLV